MNHIKRFQMWGDFVESIKLTSLQLQLIAINNCNQLITKKA